MHCVVQASQCCFMLYYWLWRLKNTSPSVSRLLMAARSIAFSFLTCKCAFVISFLMLTNLFLALALACSSLAKSERAFALIASIWVCISGRHNAATHSPCGSVHVMQLGCKPGSCTDPHVEHSAPHYNDRDKGPADWGFEFMHACCVMPCMCCNACTNCKDQIVSRTTMF